MSQNRLLRAPSRARAFINRLGLLMCMLLAARSAGARAAPSAEPDSAVVETLEEAAESNTLSADAELEASEAIADDGAAFSRSPAAGKGVVWGVVSDGVERDTLPDATVSVPGTGFKTLSDYDGRFRLELPPGQYRLRIYVELYRPALVKEVTVVAGKLMRIDVDVLPDEAAVETVAVTVDADVTTVEGQMLARQRATAVGDGVGRKEIARTPAGNAAQAAQRIVGATIVGNRFVYVRGLGERYTNALLNGVPLPSPEPDRAAIPLDLFPSLILESITVVKTFTPDVPADFAGGSVRIATRELPSKPLFQLSVNAGYDTSTTFRERLSHRGSPTEFLGADFGTRPLPRGFPSYVLVPNAPRPSGGQITREEILEAGRSVNSSMDPTRSLSLPNYGVGVVAGNGWSLGGEKRFGALASFNYSRSFKLRDDVHARVVQPNTEPDPLTGAPRKVLSTDKDLKLTSGEDKVAWNALGSVSYWPAQAHRLSLLAFHTQLADASTQLAQGFYAGQMAEVANVRLRYVSRALNVIQLRGEHELSGINAAELSWNAGYSVAIRTEPDTRNTVYQFNPDQASWNAPNSPENGSHLFAAQNERAFGGGVDWTQPLLRQRERLKLKAGGLLNVRERSFAARRFTFDAAPGAPIDPFRCPGPSYRLECPRSLYQYDNIGPVLGFSERTFPEDAYRADLSVLSGYLMLDAHVLSDLQVVAGARVERTDQQIDPYSQFTNGDDPEGARIRSTDLLPALSLTYSATKRTKLRFALSRTLARPQIRELSPYVFTDYFGARPVSGDPNLKLTYIQNADLRFEAFPTRREVLAFSFFYKLFDDPIEPYIFPSGEGIVSFQNAKGARLLGVELEARKGLGFVVPALTDVSLIGNVTLTHSRIELDDSSLLAVTNKSRAMVNQAPYVVNLALDYAGEALGLDVRLLYNVVGPRIVEVGTSDLDDAYEQPRHSVDATIAKSLGRAFQLKLNAINLLNAPFLVTLGKSSASDRVLLHYREGLIVALSLTYTL